MVLKGRSCDCHVVFSSLIIQGQYGQFSWRYWKDNLVTVKSFSRNSHARDKLAINRFFLWWLQEDDLVVAKLFSCDGREMDNVTNTKSFSWDGLEMDYLATTRLSFKGALYLIINMVDAKLFDFTPSWNRPASVEWSCNGDLALWRFREQKVSCMISKTHYYIV